MHAFCYFCMHYREGMGVTVQVRDLDAGVQSTLRAAAERRGVSLSAFLRAELTELADRIALEQRAAQLGALPKPLGIDPGFFDGISGADIVSMVREDRDS